MKVFLLINIIVGFLLSNCSRRNENTITQTDSLHYELNWIHYNDKINLVDLNKKTKIINVSIGYDYNLKESYQLVCDIDSIPVRLIVTNKNTIKEYFFNTNHNQIDVKSFGAVDKMPVLLNDSNNNLLNFIKQNTIIENNRDCYGFIKFSFIIDTVGNPNFTSEPLFEYTGQCDRFIAKSIYRTKWIPAFCDNKKVNFYYFITYEFAKLYQNE